MPNDAQKISRIEQSIDSETSADLRIPEVIYQDLQEYTHHEKEIKARTLDKHEKVADDEDMMVKIPSIYVNVDEQATGMLADSAHLQENMSSLMNKMKENSKVIGIVANTTDRTTEVTVKDSTVVADVNSEIGEHSSTVIHKDQAQKKGIFPHDPIKDKAFQFSTSNNHALNNQFIFSTSGLHFNKESNEPNNNTSLAFGTTRDTNDKVSANIPLPFVIDSHSPFSNISRPMHNVICPTKISNSSILGPHPKPMFPNNNAQTR
ncbi:hypothetical protein L2E82_30521 [Cichorium intybus]|uniref:Uncharacterized protein n=1 Tax=Cichorium intybus TaxID=13427 RepID=A0ACB9D123_CICIN|nr:hypothetical protein L2E82_30521 [Cichorium intybus]